MRGMGFCMGLEGVLGYFTTPRTRREKVPSLPLLYTAMSLENWPGRPAGLNVMVIRPSLPGAMGSRLYSGVVQPQEGTTLVSTRGWLPVFLTMNVCVTLPSASLISPKSCSGLSMVSTGPVVRAYWATATPTTRSRAVIIQMNFFIFNYFSVCTYASEYTSSEAIYHGQRY